MHHYIVDLMVVENESCFFTDDQQAIRAGAKRDGFSFRGAPVTAGFERIRQPGRAISLVLRGNDGACFVGDCVEVQYAGVGGRSAPMSVAPIQTHLADVRAALVGQPMDRFRERMQALDGLDLPPWLEYGVSQAVLRATAHARGCSMAEVVVDEWALARPTGLVPTFAQSGDGGRDACDKMILKAADALPHGLINNVEKVGPDGSVLLEWVTWLAHRVKELAPDPSYSPTMHFDTYGTLGLVFGGVSEVGDYIIRLEQAASPYPLRIEHPIDAGSRDAQIETLGALRSTLRARGSAAAIVADEWCNTLDDIELFASSGAVDMVHVKTPDLGGLHRSVEGILLSKAHGAQAYAGGTCNETVSSSQVCAHVALATSADLTLAKPGMGVDEGLSVMRNEMRLALAAWKETPAA